MYNNDSTFSDEVEFEIIIIIIIKIRVTQLITKSHEVWKWKKNIVKPTTYHE